MADIKISALPAATAVTAADVAPIVSGGVTSKATGTQIVTAALNATKVTIAQGGTGQGTAAAARTALLPAQTGLAGTALVTNGTDVSFGSAVSVTSYDATSAASITHNIPAWVKRVTVSYVGVSHAGASPAAVAQLAVGGTAITTGYVGVANQAGGNTPFTGFFISANVTSATGSINGMFEVLNLGGNLWQQNGQSYRTVDDLYSSQICYLQAAGVVNAIILTAGSSVYDSGKIVVTME